MQHFKDERSGHPLRRHFYRVGPSGALLLALGFLWVWAGVATWNDLIGRPRDAPHLMFDGHIRSAIWIGTGLLAIYAHLVRSNLRALANGLLFIMPTVRLVSYAFSWVISFELVDGFVPDRVLEGDPNAYGSMWIYLAIDLLVLCSMWAPRTWEALRAAQEDGGTDSGGGGQ